MNAIRVFFLSDHEKEKVESFNAELEEEKGLFFFFVLQNHLLRVGFLLWFCCCCFLFLCYFAMDIQKNARH